MDGANKYFYNVPNIFSRPVQDPHDARRDERRELHPGPAADQRGQEQEEEPETGQQRGPVLHDKGRTEGTYPKFNKQYLFTFYYTDLKP